MLTGAHVILYSKDADADREFVRTVLGFPHVDVGHGWLIFALPPAEVAVHPTEDAPSHEFYLMTDDVAAFIASMKKQNVPVSEISEQRWGSLVQVTMPSGTNLGVYQPKHASPSWKSGAKKPATSAKKPSQPKKPAARAKKSAKRK